MTVLVNCGRRYEEREEIRGMWGDEVREKFLNSSEPEFPFCSLRDVM